MILHRNGLTVMDYDVTTDILTVRWLDLKNSTGPEIRYSIELLLDTIRSYDIKKLLIDAREEVANLTDEEYVELNTNFANMLVATRLKKIARLGADNRRRENLVETLADDVLSLPTTETSYQNFSDETTARKWLLAK